MVFLLQTTEWLIMEFSERLSVLRKERSLTHKRPYPSKSACISHRSSAMRTARSSPHWMYCAGWP